VARAAVQAMKSLHHHVSPPLLSIRLRRRGLVQPVHLSGQFFRVIVAMISPCSST
jgi:hypothetical protein